MQALDIRHFERSEKSAFQARDKSIYDVRQGEYLASCVFL